MEQKAKHPLASPMEQKAKHPLASPCQKSEASTGFPLFKGDGRGISKGGREGDLQRGTGGGSPKGDGRGISKGGREGNLQRDEGENAEQFMSFLMN